MGSQISHRNWKCLILILKYKNGLNYLLTLIFKKTMPTKFITKVQYFKFLVLPEAENHNSKKKLENLGADYLV